MPYYNRLPQYLYQPEFTLYADKLINKHLNFLDRDPRLKLLHSINHASNAFYCRNINWDNYEFVVSSYAYKLNEKPTDGRVMYAVSHNSHDPVKLFDIQTETPFFTNLSLSAIPDNQVEPVFVNKGIYYHTFEVMAHEAFDDQALLNEQILWTFKKVTSGSEDKCDGSVLDIICKRLLRYQDFQALFCVYDGNKKLQIHTEWDIRGLSPEKYPNPYIKDEEGAKYEPIQKALMMYWEEIGRDVAEVIKDYRGITVHFNRKLRSPKSDRRLAWGIRRITEVGEFFNIGDYIPQIELYANPKKSMFEQLSASKRLHVPTRKNR